MIQILLFCILLSHIPVSALPPATPKLWMQVEQTIVPLREDITRKSATAGFVSKGQVLAVEKTEKNWVKVRVNDTLVGWVPVTALSPSGPPVSHDQGYLKVVALAVGGAGLLVFLFLFISLQIKRKGESRERTRQAMVDVKRRLQNKIQLVFDNEPRLQSHLAMDNINLREFLTSIGYVANLENHPEKLLSACKTYKPNLIMAGYEFYDQIEKMIETDAMLINTPIVYLQCANAPKVSGERVRTFLDVNASEKEISEAVSLSLKKSPDKIRYSVKPMALKGSVYSGTLMELLHFLAAVKRSGHLLVVSGSVKADILLDRGDINTASMNGMTGMEAVGTILNLSSGSFEFHEKVGRSASGIGRTPTSASLNTQKALMEWAKSKDESNHHTRT